MWWKLSQVFLGLSFLLLFSIQLQTCNAHLDKVKTALTIGYSVYKTFSGTSEGDSIKDLAVINNLLNEMSKDTQTLEERTIRIITHLVLEESLEKQKKFFNFIQDLNRTSTKFEAYLRAPNSYTEKQVISILNICEEYYKDRTDTWILGAHEELVDSAPSLVSFFTAEDESTGYTMCETGLTPQQMIEDLFTTLVIAEKRAMSCILFSIKKSPPHGNFNLTAGIERTLNEHTTRISHTMKKVKTAMYLASRTVYKCDPKIHIKDFTYAKIELFQGYLLLEAEMFDKSNKAAIPYIWNAVNDLMTKSCGYYKQHEKIACDSRPCQEQPKYRRCDGILRNCQKFEDKMQVCHSVPGDDRRYDWARNEHGTVYGNYYDNCLNTQGWEGLLSNDPCICNCEDQNYNVPRYIAGNMISDFQNGKVITGIRFTKRGNVIRTDIQHGKLGPNATIIGDTEWRNDDRDYSQELNKNNANSYLHTFSYNAKTIYLDDWDVAPNNVIVGVYLVKANKDSNDEAIRLKIETARFDYATGQLFGFDRAMFTSGNTARERTQILPAIEPNDPTKAIVENHEQSETNSYVELGLSDLKEDLWQNTVPFFDLQPVVTKPPMPLSSIGLYHRGSKYSGGFIGYRVKHVDYSHYL